MEGCAGPEMDMEWSWWGSLRKGLMCQGELLPGGHLTPHSGCSTKQSLGQEAPGALTNRMERPSLKAKLQQGLVCAPRQGRSRAWHGMGTCHTAMCDTDQEFIVKLHPLLPPHTWRAGRQQGDHTAQCETRKPHATLGKRSWNRKIDKLSNQVMRTLEKVGRD